MRVIGLDVGEKRIGVAVADTIVKIASPHSTIIVDDTELDQVKKIMADENTNLVVVGLPRNSHGLETAQTKIVRLFATELQARGARIKFQDESLTSVMAERRLKQRGKPYKKEDIDAEAATIILQDFIEGFRDEKGVNEGGSRNIKPSAALKNPSSGLSESAGSAGVFKARNVSEKRPHSLLPKVVIIIFIFGASLAAVWFASGTTAVKNQPLKQPFTISEGQSTSEIADALVSAGLVKNATTFQLAARLTGASIPAKTHFLSPAQNTWQIIDQIKNK